MAFATLEDLEGHADLVFFPRTWRAVREQVQVDQVMLVVGQVQQKENETDISLIVDNVITKLETAHDADGRATPPLAETPATYATSAAPATARTAAPFRTSVAESNGRNGAPPPPPNFEDDIWQNDGIEDDYTVDDDNDLLEDEAVVEDTPQPAPSLAADETIVTRGGKEIAVPAADLQRGRLITVDIKPAGSWQEACRRAVQKAGDFQGRDTLRIRFTGQGIVLNFPESATDFCPELIEELEKIPGVMRVYGG